MQEAQEPTIEVENDVLAENTDDAASSREVEVEAEAEETGTEVEANIEAEEEEPKKGGIQKRIDELTRQRYEAEERARQREEEALAARRRLQELENQRVQVDWQNSRPTLDDFETVDEFARAYDQWYLQGLQRQAQAQQEQQRAYQEQQNAIQKQVAISRKMADAQAKYPDFIEKINNPSLPSLAELNQAAYEAVVDSDVMADVTYYLANNPAEVYRFGEMSPIQAIKEVARIEERVKAPQQISQTTSAPPPARPSKAGKSSGVKDPDKMTTEEFIAWRNETAS